MSDYTPPTPHKFDWRSKSELCAEWTLFNADGEWTGFRIMFIQATKTYVLTGKGGACNAFTTLGEAKRYVESMFIQNGGKP